MILQKQRMIETNARPPTAPPAYDTAEQLSYQQNRSYTTQQLCDQCNFIAETKNDRN